LVILLDLWFSRVGG